MMKVKVRKHKKTFYEKLSKRYQYTNLINMGFVIKNSNHRGLTKPIIYRASRRGIIRLS